MRLVEFTVENYKVFKKPFNIKFNNSSISILTGKNNMGKSTLLEAINRFFMTEPKAKTIEINCFSNQATPIIFTAIFEGAFQFEAEESTESINIENTKLKRIEITKKYNAEQAPKFYGAGSEIRANHPYKIDLEQILENPPFYITPYMNPDDINSLIQNIYSEVLKNRFESLFKIDEPNKDEEELINEFNNLKNSYPRFLSKIKRNTDKTLEEISSYVSSNLQNLFSNNTLNLEIRGGESSGFSANDILKSTNSTVHISNSIQPDSMPLSNQGTGLQRMSLIYLIQNMIEKKVIGGENQKLLLIDEPEAFLHPEAVRALSKSLYTIGSQMPLLISTHSPVLIDLSEKHTSIQLFRVNQKKNQALELYQSKNDTFDDDDFKNLKILNYVDSYVNEFFFADKIIIVEGDTEYITFKHFAEQAKQNIHIIRARGKGTIQTLMKILNQFDIKYYVLHDIDNNPNLSITTLKSQKTMCENIFKLKQNKKQKNLENEIFVSETTFEIAIGLHNISNSEKTKIAYKITQYKEHVEEEFKEQYEKIRALFDYIILEKHTIDAFLNTGFHNVSNIAFYNEKFDDLIN